MSQMLKTTDRVRGWCPGALRPMESGDGLIVRIRPRCGALDLDAFEAILNEAQQCGNGIVELTRRANLQLRGVRSDELPRLHAALRGFDLLDETADQESVRNIMLSPLSGIAADDLYDMRPVARALEQHLLDDKRLWRLPGKFGFSLDSGAKPSLDNERADIRLKALCRADGETAFAIGIDRPSGIVWLGHSKNNDPAHLAGLLARTAISLIKFADSTSAPVARVRNAPEPAVQEIQRELAPHFDGPLALRDETLNNDAGADNKTTSRPAPLECVLGVNECAAGRKFIGVAAPFGSLEATSWQQLVTNARAAGVAQIRLTPWRAVILPIQQQADAQRFLASLEQVGFITDPTNPLLRIDACPGKPHCRSANAQTRSDARVLARALADYDKIRSVHISGCTKGCARSMSADCLLVAEAGGYAVSYDAAHAESGAPIVAFADVARGLELADKERTKRA